MTLVRTFNFKSTVHLANTLAIIQGKSLNFRQFDYPKPPQDTPGQHYLYYERVDDVLVLIYIINVMWLYLFACIFRIHVLDVWLG